MDLGDWLFEAEYEAEAANKAHKDGREREALSHIDAVERAVSRIREMTR